ncbi:hypothetical protein M3C61_12225 [Dermacoccus abyssi]|uniref:hypothetical protein n=1 Tax=Dermacoccus abyssi TaxID=322596 RepID=UPI0021A3CDC8|nr:hypothetical protein [Dermacoccus abyssi]
MEVDDAGTGCAGGAGGVGVLAHDGDGAGVRAVEEGRNVAVGAVRSAVDRHLFDRRHVGGFACEHPGFGGKGSTGVVDGALVEFLAADAAEHLEAGRDVWVEGAAVDDVWAPCGAFARRLREREERFEGATLGAFGCGGTVRGGGTLGHGFTVPDSLGACPRIRC